MPMPNRNNINNNYRYAYQGQEKDPETGKEAFELRLWDSRIGRWLTTDPYGEFHSPYLGMGNNPISLIDPDGGSTQDNFKLDKKTGELTLVEHTKDNFDQIGKVSRKGKFKAKITNIKKGIIKDGINFKENFNIINFSDDINKRSVSDFVIKLSDYLGTEISGFGFSNKNDLKVDDQSLNGYLIEPYKNNSFNSGVTKAFSLNQSILGLGINKSIRANRAFIYARIHFHTHPYHNKEIGIDLFRPSDEDFEHKKATNGLPHIIFSSDGNKRF